MVTLSTPEIPTTEPAVQPGPPENKNEQDKTNKPLDILFLQDATGSQGPYITSARTAIQEICTKISSSASLSKGALRFGLIAFRDHPPQDNTFVTKNFGFTDNVDVMKTNLQSLTATGGGDGPEASTAALAEALNTEWKDDAVKIVVLITDAPPHGIGEQGDGFRDGSPDQNDPLDIARQMAERGITLYVIACEPALSRYLHAVDFYRALCQITSGRMVPLLNASQLGDYIVGSAVETMETEALIGEFQNVILEDVYGQGKPIEEVMQNVQQQMQQRNVQINTLNVEDIYVPSKEAEFNTNVWATSGSLSSARGRTQMQQQPRLKSSFAPPPPTLGAFSALSTGATLGGATLGGAAFGAMTASSAFGAPAASMAPYPSAPCTTTWSSAPAPRSRVPPQGVQMNTHQPMRPVPATMPQQQQQQQAVQMQQQQVDLGQTKRVVMQSLMRNAKVGAGGVLTPKGEYAGRAIVQVTPQSAPAADTDSVMHDAT